MPLESAIAEFAKAADEGDFDTIDVSIIAAISRANHDWPWDGLIKALTGALQADKGSSGPQLVATISGLMHLSHTEINATNALASLTSRGHLFHYMEASAHPEAEALCALCVLIFRPAGDPEQVSGSSQAGVDKYKQMLSSLNDDDERVEIIANGCATHGWTATLAANTQKSHDITRLAGHIIRRIAERSDATTHITSEYLIKQHPFFSEALDDEQYDALTEKVAGGEPFIEEVLTLPFDPALSRLYISVLVRSKECKPGTRIHDFLRTGLAQLTKEDWLEHLKHEHYVIGLVLKLVVGGASLELSTPFNDALLRHAKDLVEADVKVEKYRDEWKHIVQALDETYKKIFPETLLRDVVLGSGETKGQLLVLYGELLASGQEIESQANQVVSGGFKAFLQRLEIVELEWMLSVFQHHPSLLGKCSLHVRRDFENRVKHAWKRDEITDNCAWVLRLVAEREY